MSNPYNVSLIAQTVDSTVYEFTCDNALVYIVNFTKAAHYVSDYCDCPDNLYEVSFFPKNGATAEPDRKISDTIIELIKFFIKSTGAPLLYTCDSSDHREKCRNKLFTRWFEEGNKEHTFLHDFREIEYSDSTLFAGVITSSGDVNFEKYFEQIDSGNLDK